MEVEVVTKKEALRRMKRANLSMSQVPVGNPPSHMEITIFGIIEKGFLVAGAKPEKFRYKLRGMNAKKIRKPAVKPVFRSYFIDEANSNDKVFLKSTDKRMVISLQLQSEGGRKRKIGTVTLSTRTMEIKRDREKHLFRKLNAYGFNDYVLRVAKQFNTIRLSDGEMDWKIPVSFILDQKNGSYLQFKNEGYEKQKFISLEELGQFRVYKKEKRRL